MPAGRPPKPKKLHLLEGTYRADRHGKKELPKSAVPEIPAQFKNDPRKRALWNELVSTLGPNGLDIIHLADRKMMEMMCNDYDEVLKLGDDIAKEGFVYESLTETGVIQRANPKVGMKDQAFRRLKSLASEFGMTPAARNKVAQAAQKAEDDSYTNAKVKAW
jgi:P27 family predicted phage terminase small subunit